VGEVALVAAEVPEVEGVAMVAVRKDFAFGPGAAKGVEALGDGPVVEFEVDVDDGQSGARAPPPGLAAGDAEGEVEEAPALIALAGAAQDHFAALVQDAFDDLRGRSGSDLDELPQGEDLRQRRG